MAGRAGHDGDGDLDLVSYCARPLCRAEFRQSAGRGRRRDYCSDMCRRLADRDFKRAQAMLAHFEELAARARHDLAAFGRAGEELAPGTDQALVLARASGAVDRASAVLDFSSEHDHALYVELKRLHDAVVPALAGDTQRDARVGNAPSARQG